MKNNELRTRLKTLETKLDTMSQAQHLQLENKEEVSFLPQVSTCNRFTPLEADSVVKHSENDDAETFGKQASNDQVKQEMLFIMDSHGNGLDPQKMYRRIKSEIVVLQKGEKNINGAKKSAKTWKHLAI